jgi:hypothetical protein
MYYVTTDRAARGKLTQVHNQPTMVLYLCKNEHPTTAIQNHGITFVVSTWWSALFRWGIVRLDIGVLSFHGWL